MCYFLISSIPSEISNLVSFRQLPDAVKTKMSSPPERQRNVSPRLARAKRKILTMVMAESSKVVVGKGRKNARKRSKGKSHFAFRLGIAKFAVCVGQIKHFSVAKCDKVKICVRLLVTLTRQE